MDYRSQSAADLPSRTKWYIYLRWIFIAVIILPGLLPVYLLDGWSLQVQVGLVLGLLAFVSNGTFYLVSRRIQAVASYRLLAISMLITDILLISYLILIKGGIESRSPILYTIPILISAAILGRKAIYSTAAAAIVTYDLIVIGDYYDILKPCDLLNIPAHETLSYTLNSMIFFSSIFIVIGLTADFMTRLLIDKEQQVSEHLNNLNRAQSVARFGSWTWNLETNELEWSKVMYELFSITEDGSGVTPKAFFEKIHPDDRKTIYAAIRKARKRLTSFSLDFRIIPNEEEIRYIHTDGQIVKREKDGVYQMLGTSRDITEEHLLDQAKNEFVALASHQLRTPSTIVKQYLSMLIDGYAGKLSAKQKEYVSTAYKSNERQITTVNDLLNVAQIDSGKMKLHYETFDLVDFLSGIVTEQSIRLNDKHQSIILKSRLKKLECYADRHRLRMALENIIDNAHKYSPENKQIELLLSRTAHLIQIGIKDYGIGINKKDLPKIFHKFTRIDNPASLMEEGTGLGLYWVEKVIQLHGGTIDIASTIHQGTVFTINLPRHPTKIR